MSSAVYRPYRYAHRVGRPEIFTLLGEIRVALAFVDVSVSMQSAGNVLGAGSSFDSGAFDTEAFSMVAFDLTSFAFGVASASVTMSVQAAAVQPGFSQGAFDSEAFDTEAFDPDAFAFTDPEIEPDGQHNTFHRAAFSPSAFDPDSFALTGDTTVILATANVSVLIAASATPVHPLHGSFSRHAFSDAAFSPDAWALTDVVISPPDQASAAMRMTVGAQATGVTVAYASSLAVGETAGVDVERHGPQQADVSMTIVLRARGTRVRADKGAEIIDARLWVERQIDRVPSYRFGSGFRTREFYQRGK